MNYLPVRLTGEEPLTNSDVSLSDTTVLDFWRWAFSDLRANNIRGVFAEWLVAKLLGIDVPVRDSWAGWDLEAPGGVKIEVKTSAYLQTWTQGDRLSSILFTGLKGQLWALDTGYSDTATYNADLYIFCVQIEQNPARWNALDLDQWRFYLLPREELMRRDCKSISLQTLSAIAQVMIAAELRKHSREAIALVASRNSPDVTAL